MAEGAFVQDLRVLASTSQPPRDGGLPKAEDPFGRRCVQPFGQRRQDHRDLLRGGFQAIQRRVASSTEGGVTGLTAKRLDLLGMTVLAISNQRVDWASVIPQYRHCGLGQA